MRGTLPRLFCYSTSFRSNTPVVKIESGTFYRHHPTHTENNPPIFPDLSFSVHTHGEASDRWAVVGPSSSGKTTFLEVLRGYHLCQPPGSRSFPALAHPNKVEPGLRDPLKAIQYVGFSTRGGTLGGAETKGAYLNARYESRKEVTDFSLLDYLIGNTKLNPTPEDVGNALRMRDSEDLKSIVQRLNLQDLLELPVSHLSNGQTRRAKIAKALTGRPLLLLLDEPFLGLDPMTKVSMSSLLESILHGTGPSILLAVQSLEEAPGWVTHILQLGNDLRVHFQGSRKDIIGMAGSMASRSSLAKNPNKAPAKGKDNIGTKNIRSVLPGEPRPTTRTVSRNSAPFKWHSVEDLAVSSSAAKTESKEPLVEMQGVQISYGKRRILGHWDQELNGEKKSGLWWTIRRGDRWGVFGPNGSGKTTLLSLVCSDHPQAYSLPIKIFGRSRLPELGMPGISIFDIQSRIGQASPEVHNYFPRNLTIRQTLENAWAETFLSRPRLTYDIDTAVDACLRWFQLELDPNFSGPDLQDSLVTRYNLKEARAKSSKQTQHAIKTYMDNETDWADNIMFRDISFSSQRVALFLRAIIRKPDIVILDEAFSGMDERTRIKCMLFLAYGESTWLLKNTSKKSTATLAYRSKMPTLLKKYDKVTVGGLESRQALLCVSHRQEEVPPITSQWICLPDSDEGKAARFGTLPFQETYEWPKEYWWKEIWQQK